MAFDGAKEEQTSLWGFYHRIDAVSNQYQAFLKDQSDHSPDIEGLLKEIRNYRVVHKTNAFLYQRVLEKLLFFDRTWQQWRHDRWSATPGTARNKRGPNHYALQTAERVSENEEKLRQLYAIQSQRLNQAGRPVKEDLAAFKQRLAAQYARLKPDLERGRKLVYAWIADRARCDLLVEKRNYPEQS